MEINICLKGDKYMLKHICPVIHICLTGDTYMLKER